MMKSRVVVVVCLLTLTALSFCDYPTLSSISDLIREVSKGTVPSHAVILLYWFANNIEMDNNNHVCISFNPNQDFGSHYYGNRENLLRRIDNNVFSYFTVGSITRPQSVGLPDYFREIQFSEDGWNVDRVIICASRVAQNTGSRSISQVYLTRHFQQQNQRNTAYDPNLTFIISPNLLRQLRQFESDNNVPSMDQLRNLRDQFNNNINYNQLRDLRNTWQNEARLGLLHLIVSPGSYGHATRMFQKCMSKRRFGRQLGMTCEWQNCDKENFQVTHAGNGYARITWRNVPEQNLKDGVAVALYKNVFQDTPLTSKKITRSQGSYDTSVLMNEWLQVRLHKTKLWWPTDEICKGEEFESPESVSVDSNVDLRLVVKDGKACFRLDVKSGGHKYIYEHYYYHWVALYRNRWEHSSDYLSGQWQWVINFESAPMFITSSEHNPFEYCTGATITTGLEARLIMEDSQYYYISARTTWSD